MNHLIFFDKPAVPPSGAVPPNVGSQVGAIPLYEVQFFDFTDDAITLPETTLRGIAPWDAWLQQSQITHH